MPPTSDAQPREAADAAELLAPPVADADSVDAPVQGIAQADPADAPTQAEIAGAFAKPDAGDQAAEAPARTDAEAESADAPAKPEAGAADARLRTDAQAETTDTPAGTDAEADAAGAPAQTEAEAQAADASAPSDAGDWAIGVPAQTETEADTADAPAQTEAEAETSGPTWDAVIAMVEEALVSESVAETREAADAAEALGTADLPADASDRVEEAEAEAFVTEPATKAAVQVTDWVIASHDNGDLPFIVIDKTTAALFVYDRGGELLGVTPALIGISNGDGTAEGIGELALSAITVEARTTPAGRFAAQYGYASGDRRVLWVDYESSLALHPVVTANRSERRPQRLRSPTAEDNRITFGCINVPAQFYADVIQPLFEETGGIVYILPDSLPLEDVFPALHAQSTARAEAPL